MLRAKVPNIGCKKYRSQNVTGHLNKKHVLFHVERSQQVLKTAFFLQRMYAAEQSSKRQFRNVLNVVLESFCFAQETKAVFISIRYPKTSQTQDVKSQSTKRSIRELAQPKRDSAFEQKRRIDPSREISGRSQNHFRSYNQKIKQSWAQTDILERIQRHFGKLMFSFRWIRPLFFGRFVRKSSKQLHTIQNDEDHVSEKIKSCFYKYSVPRDISNAGCKEPKCQK